MARSGWEKAVHYAPEIERFMASLLGGGLAMQEELARLTGASVLVRSNPDSRQAIFSDFLREYGRGELVERILDSLARLGWPRLLVDRIGAGLDQVSDSDGLDALLRCYGEVFSPNAAAQSAARGADGLALQFLFRTKPDDQLLAEISAWPDRDLHPMIAAWQSVWEACYGQRQRSGRLTRRTGDRAPSELPAVLSDLPIEQFETWVRFVIYKWPAAPVGYVIPASDPRGPMSWRPRAEFVVRTFLSQMPDSKRRESWASQLRETLGEAGEVLARQVEPPVRQDQEHRRRRFGGRGHSGK
jgi:hypothetical protein